MKTRNWPLVPFLLGRCMLVVFLWLLTQGLFLAENHSLFSSVSFAEACRLTFESLRFAGAGILFILSPFLVLNLIPVHYKHNRYYQGFADFWYYAAAILFFIANGIDIAYYPITHQRMNASIFKFLGGVEGDFLRLLPTFFVQYWYLTLLAVFGIFGLFFAGKHLKLNLPETVNVRYYIKQIAVFIILVPLIIWGQRGGFQNRPVDIFHAAQKTSTHADLILNTPFVILKTLGETNLEEVHYYADEEDLRAEFDPCHHYTNKIFEGPDLPNVVIIILESGSTEYSKWLSGRDVGYTPFMDSLAKQGLVYRGMSNSKHSIVGIPAIIAGMPNLMPEDYIFSAYFQNNIPSLANTLKTMGYTSSFYHGALNGSMGFDAFANKVGFDEYLGKNEYDNDKDYDGKWGIFDEPFMQYAANRITTHAQQPFLSVIYTLSAHSPWTLPKGFENRFPKGTLDAHETIGYTDYALQRFFETARTKPWFENTLFVITSDHSAMLETEYYTTTLGTMEIPMIWYFPKYIKPKREEKIMQQVDLMPSVLHYVGYDKPFVAFGQSAFDPNEQPYAIRFSISDYQLVKNGWVLNFANDQPISLKKDDQNFAKSPNLMDTQPDTLRTMERKLKAMIQQYHSRMIHNKFSVENSPFTPQINK